MTDREYRTWLTVLLIAGGLFLSTQQQHPRLSLPPLDWSIAASGLSCPYLVAPECIEPLPGP